MPFRARRRCLWLTAIISVALLIYLLLDETIKNDLFCDDNSEILRNAVSQSPQIVLDTSGTYRIFPSVFRAKSIDAPAILTLVTHSSLRNLIYLPKLVERWSAGVSVAVFVEPEMVEKVLVVLEGFRRCHPLTEEFVTFHVVSPLFFDTGRVFNGNKGERGLRECNGSVPVLYSELLKHGSKSPQNYNHHHPYPNNLLRNTARRFLPSQYYLTIDVDMLPNSHLHASFLAFLTHHPSLLPHQVFVLPVFELRHPEENVPETKEQLLGLMQRLQARPFYFEMCWKCQQPTDYARWETVEGGGLGVAYGVEWRDPWEPFFIGDQGMPWFDERFKQYGFNRISHACELFVAGYQFSVLNTAFLMHLGFKTSGNFHQTKVDELNQNRRLFATLKEELLAKYPESSRRCV